MKEPKPIKLTKKEIESFEKLEDRFSAIQLSLQNYGLELRLLWDGLKKKYNLDTLNWKWGYNRKTKRLQVYHQNPDWAKDRLMK